MGLTGQSGRAVPGPLDGSEYGQWAQRDPLGLFDDCVTRYGPDFALPAENGCERVYLGSPQAIHEAFVGGEDSLECRGSSVFRAIVGEDSVVFLNGRRHFEIRKLLGPLFMGDHMRSRAGLIEQQALRALRSVAGRGPVRLIDLTRQMTLGVMVRMVFGDLSTGEADQVADLCVRLLDAVTSPTRTDPDSPVLLCDALDEVIAGQIARHDGSSAERDGGLVGHLIRSRELEQLTLSDQQIRGHVVSLLIAGFETTASTLAWAAYFVATHESERQRLVETLESLGSATDLDAVARDPYLVAVCRETLRLSSVVPTGLTRYATADIAVGPFTIPRDSEVVPCIHVAHRSEQVFPHADQFDPSRFLHGSFGNSEFLPFGAGSRRCLGASFAAYELAIALAVLFGSPGFALAPVSLPVRGVPRGPTVSFPDAVLAEVDAQFGLEKHVQVPDRHA
jgi:unspecific monooxygenase